MFEAADGPRLFGLPPGCDVPGAIVSGLRARMSARPPEAMARVTLFLNSSRMRDRVRAAFHASGPGFLPRLRLVGDPGGMGSDPALALRRRLEVTRLVDELARRQHDFSAGTATVDLARSLITLMDEMQSEGVSPDRFKIHALPPDHARHWDRALAFLRITAPYFAADAATSGAAVQRRAIETLVADWQAAAPADPVIVAGSTGSRGATALLMQAVARLPQGAVILPGFDWDMTAEAWQSLTAGPEPDEDHPQYRFAALCDAVRCRPDAVRRWSGDQPPDAARNRLVSLALRPAPVTDRWRVEGAGLGALGDATRGLTLIEAPSPRDEALAVALVLREAAETGQRAVLITADRGLTRRVAAALDRWGLLPDDSAGQPLHQSTPGRLLLQVAKIFGRPLTAEALVRVLKHPLVATGSTMRGENLLLVHKLEVSIRRHGPAFPGPGDLRAWGAACRSASHGAWAEWVADWIERLPEPGMMPLSAATETLVDACERLAAGPHGVVSASGLWQKDAGQAALAVMDRLRSEAASGPATDGGGLAALVQSLLFETPVRDSRTVHPLVSFEGTREARELQADIVVLAGLNDGVWPGQPAPDPWLSRQMRRSLGLLSPERQIGLAAHDVQIAMAAPRVVLSRAVRDDEAPTVASRWLDRLTNLIEGLEGRTGAIDGMRRRGAHWLAMGRQIERAEKVPPTPRPAPRPPVAARPAELPVTQISRLIRDPYAVYARYVLRLRPLDPLSPEPDARLRGMTLHRIVEGLVKGWPAGAGMADGLRLLAEVTDRVLAEEVPWLSARALWRARIDRLAPLLIAGEIRRAAEGRPVVVENRGQVAVEQAGFTLTAQPDRIDILDDGTVRIFDYKSGALPTGPQMKSFEKQLPLEAAMAERGAFGKVGARRVSGVAFIQLGGGGKESAFSRDDIDPDAEWQGLIRLIGAYARRSQGYTARRALFRTSDSSEYDQLSRFGEWSAADRPMPQDVGDADA